jgi:type II secretory pathway component GspD/PulD (secretin)
MADKSRFEYVTIPLYYINADEAKKLATPLLSEFGQLGATSPAKLDTQPGQGGDSLAINDRLVVSDYPENIQKIRQMLEEVDSKPAQVLIEVTVMKAVLTEDLEYGIDWNTVEGIQVNKSHSRTASCRMVSPEP